jgi:hypothetical protein
LIDHTSWLRPGSLEISGPFLRWRTYEEGPLADDPDAVQTHSGDGLLGEFVRLKDDQEGDRILKFAGRWGVLGLCRHRLPVNHREAGAFLRHVLSLRHEQDEAISTGSTLEDDPAGSTNHATPNVRCSPARSHGWFVEPLESWRRMATVFTLISQAAEDARSQKVPKAELWSALGPRLLGVSDDYRRAVPVGRRLGVAPAPVSNLPPIDEQMSERARDLLGLLVDDLMRLGDVRLGFEWTGPLPEVNLEPGGLFGALAVDLAFAVGRASGFAFCDGCGDVYAPSRRPVRGKRSYCQRCRDRGVPVLDAQRDRRRRLSDAKRLADQHAGS